MSETATFPSAALPAPPGFTFDVPDGWVVAEFPGTLGAVSVPGPADELWINVQIRHERVVPGVTLEAAALASWARLILTNPQATVDMEREGTFGGKVCYLRSAYLNIPDTEQKVMQLDALFLAPPVPGRDTFDLFQLVGTVDEDKLLAFTEAFLAITKSFTFTD